MSEKRDAARRQVSERRDAARRQRGGGMAGLPAILEEEDESSGDSDVMDNSDNVIDSNDDIDIIDDDRVIYFEASGMAEPELLGPAAKSLLLDIVDRYCGLKG